MLRVKVALIFCLVSHTVMAQSKKGTISGAVQDASGDAIPGATVVLANTPHGITTDENGRFALSNIPYGQYSIQVSFVGYQTILEPINLETKNYDGLTFELKESSAQLNSVTVTGKSESQLKKEEPIQIESVRLQEIVEQVKDLNDALITLPGVRVQSSGSLGDRSDISINGLSGQAIRTYTDGLPFEFLYPSLSIANIPLNTVERIDVYKGVVPVDVGTDALAGAVNVVSQKKIGDQLQAFYSYGSFNTHQAGFNGSVKLNDKLSLQLNAAYNYSDNNYTINAPVVVPIDEFNSEIVEMEVERFNDGYELIFAETSLTLTNSKLFDFAKVNVGYSTYEKEVNNNFRISTDAWGEYLYTGDVTLTSFQFEKNLGNRAELFSNLAYSYSTITTIDTTSRNYFWDGRFETGNRGENADNPTLAQRNNNNAVNRTTLKLGLFENDELLISNIFAYQDIFGRDPEVNAERDLLTQNQSILKNVTGVQYTKLLGKLRLNAAAKLYHYSLEGVNRARTPVSKSQQELGYYVAGKYDFNERIFLRGSYEMGFRIPNLGEFFGNGVFIVQNTGLRPETSNNFNLELGYKSSALSNVDWGIETNFFFRDTNDLIFLNPTEINPRFTNQQSVNTLGFETEAYVFITPKLKLTNNVTKFSQEIREVANTTDEFLIGTANPNTPDFIAFSQLEYNSTDLFNKGDAFRVYAQYYFVDTFNFIFEAPNFNPDNWVPTQHRTNLGFTYFLPERKWSFSGNVFNVLNNELFDNFAIPRPGRNFNIRISCRLDNF